MVALLLLYAASDIQSERERCSVDAGIMRLLYMRGRKRERKGVLFYGPMMTPASSAGGCGCVGVFRRVAGGRGRGR